MRSQPAIAVDGLVHHYGTRKIHDGLSFSVEPGRILGLLGKNGVGKTTLIKILMGFLTPDAGRCRVLGEPSHALSAEAKRRIGLVFEGHLAYDFMSIEEIERFTSKWYPKWRRDVFYDLVDRLHLPVTHRIRNMSEGQRSQVVLGLVMAQDPDLLILDDYTMGLDAGYRRLFLDYLVHYAREGEKTVFVTSHVVQDMERLVDDVILIRRGARVLQTSLDAFMSSFRRYDLPPGAAKGELPSPDGALHRMEMEADGRLEVFAFKEQAEVEAELRKLGIDASGIAPREMTLEDAFVGYTGKY
ncbi:ABC transporter ATP-binding protein [Tropicimonas marinistellae]|uniref:ABC transporter ATP-binding protein n=1 Tax=Tropicimonas marinistellae TaxID=1739787 RepID=UPI000836868D|nr:ABC transporter ATP-binding protein [Tropicimonas marinistellae]